MYCLLCLLSFPGTFSRGHTTTVSPSHLQQGQPSLPQPLRQRRPALARLLQAALPHLRPLARAPWLQPLPLQRLLLKARGNSPAFPPSPPAFIPACFCLQMPAS